MTDRTDWAGMMAIGFGHLRLSSAQFWALTPKEFNAACIGLFGISPNRQPMPRDALSALQDKFPDRM